LNTVRKQLSKIKGGGLARSCRAGRMITLIISDVLGDPLDTIASGPTVEDPGTPQDAVNVLEKYRAREAGISDKVFAALEKVAANAKRAAASPKKPPPKCQVTNVVIGNNATAVDAAGQEAERRGYSHAMLAAKQLEGPAEEIGRHHASMAEKMRRESGPDCLITGGEPTVQLVDAKDRGKGGRNQQLVLAAFQQLAGDKPASSNPLSGMTILSGGTDGEDGPTDAAGAFIDAQVWDTWRSRQLDPAEFLRRNDAYHFFEPLDALLKTGPTHTNVCDVRVALVSRN
jgi:glycerate-2-kinase